MIAAPLRTKQIPWGLCPRGLLSCWLAVVVRVCFIGFVGFLVGLLGVLIVVSVKRIFHIGNSVGCVVGCVHAVCVLVGFIFLVGFTRFIGLIHFPSPHLVVASTGSSAPPAGVFQSVEDVISI